RGSLQTPRRTPRATRSDACSGGGRDMTRRRRAAFVIVLLGVLLTGCAKGFNRGQMDSALRASSPRYTSSGLSVEEIEKLQPQVQMAIRLALGPPSVPA